MSPNNNTAERLRPRFMTALLGCMSRQGTYRHESRNSLVKSWGILLVCLILGPLSSPAQADKTFAYTLFQEPTTLDPQMLTSASGNYLVTVIYRGLYQWSLKRGLTPDEGHCRWSHKNLRLTCSLFDHAKWSDGSRVTARDYLRTFQSLIDPEFAAPMSDSLTSIQNAKTIREGKKDLSQLGFEVIDDSKFVIRFERPDSEFLFKLVHPALYPRHASFERRFKPSKDFPVSNGPFKISKWRSESYFEMVRNPHFPTSGENLVKNLKALIVDSDVTSLQLFETHKIQFLRRLPAQEFERFKYNPAFFQFPVLRFDYVGFSPALRSQAKLRESLATSFDPLPFQRLFSTEGKPGCPSLPKEFYNGNQCEKLNQKKKPSVWPLTEPPYFGFSQMGGDDIQRAAEWFQSQWKNLLNISFELHSREQKSYLSWLKTNPPPLFRKGVSLDRPTCLAALENFSEHHPENYIGFKNTKFEKVLSALSQTFGEIERKRLCTQGLKMLIGGHHLIPLGEIKFTGLADTHFRGWKLNELNQLDLRDLSYFPKTSEKKGSH